MVAGLIVGVLGTAVWASFITYWPYNLSLTLKNYDFGTFDAAAWSPYFNSLKMAALAAIIGTAIVFTGAYLVEKTKVRPAAAPSRISSPCCRWRCRAWCWAGLCLLRQRRLESAQHLLRHAARAGGQFRRAFLHGRAYHGADRAEADRSGIRIRVGLAQSAGLAHVPPRHGADLHAGDFRHRDLYVRQRAHDRVGRDLPLRPGTKLASVAIVHMDEAGVTAGAAAMATLIVLTALAAKLLHVLPRPLLSSCGCRRGGGVDGAGRGEDRPRAESESDTNLSPERRA